MLLMMYLFIIFSILMMIMMTVNFLFSKKMLKNREKSSPFECGFDPISSNRLPFSLQFYLISIIFLIFDVEIAMILPMILSNSMFMYFYNFNNILIMVILLLGLYMEMYEGALKWFK